MKHSPAPAELDLHEMAAIDFEPLTDLPATWQPPTNLQWSELANPHLISVRLAWLMLQKSKADLIGAVSALGDDASMELVAQIGRSADWFEGLHKLLASAECRIMCAYATGALNSEAVK